MTELICIVCPKGCRLKVDEDDDFSVSGNDCPRGDDYGKTELMNPTRVITSTVVVNGGIHRRCPVKTDGAIPKKLILEAMKSLNDVKLVSTVPAGSIVVSDICGTGVNFVTTRDI